MRGIPKFGRKRGLGVVLFVLILLGLGTFYFAKGNRQGTKKADQSTVATALAMGKCDDEVLGKLTDNLKTTNGNKTEEAEASKLLANCYVYRQDYKAAVTSYQRAKQAYEANGNFNESKAIDEVLSSIEDINSAQGAEVKEFNGVGEN